MARGTSCKAATEPDCPTRRGAVAGAAASAAFLVDTSPGRHSMTRPRRVRGPAVQSPLETYLREINETALLNANEEKELAYRIEKGDAAARDRMVRANLRLVVNIA